MASVTQNISFQVLVCSTLDNDANGFQTSQGFEIVQAGALRFDRLWRFGGATLAAMRNKADLIFAPSPIFPTGACPAVTTIHDATPLRFPTLTRSKNALARSLVWASANFSRKVITDSEWSKKDLVELYGIPPERVKVVYLGYDHDFFNCDPVGSHEQRSLLDSLNIRGPYIFHHGVVQPRKNLQRLIQAYRLVLDRRPELDLQLVIAGPLGWEYEEVLHTANERKSRGAVIFAGRLPDREMALVLKAASLCVIPSFYEGFCLPLVEAMACGVPTIAADASCLPEVSGKMLLYFDPYSVEDMADLIWQVLDDQSVQRRLVQNGVDRASQFCWERCARETLQVLKESCLRAMLSSSEVQKA